MCAAERDTGHIRIDRSGVIPVFSARRDGPTQVALVFRVGVTDEDPTSAGITHLVEHLALDGLRQRTFAYNGEVDWTTASFHAMGRPDEARLFLKSVVTNLSALPVDRLDAEVRILVDEAAARPDDLLARHAALRYGLRGPGTASLGEIGLFRVGGDDVRAWAAKYFTAGNAALAWVGPEEPDLELDLPRGARHLPIAPPEQIDRAVWATDHPGRITVSVSIPHQTGAGAGMRILGRRLQQRLRFEQGISYDISEWSVPVSSDRGFAIVSATTSDPDAAAVRDAFVETIDALRTDGPTAEELAADVASIRIDAGPDPLVADVGSLAWRELIGAPVESIDQLADRRSRLTCEDVRVAFEGAMATAVLGLPSTAAPPAAGFAPYPDPPDGPTSGSRFIDRRERPFLLPVRYPSLVVGPEAIRLEAPEGRGGIRLAWDQVAVIVRGRDGGLSLLSRNGDQIVVEPRMMWRGRQLASAVAAAVPSSRFVDLPWGKQDSGPVAATTRASSILAAFGAFLLLSIGVSSMAGESDVVPRPNLTLLVSGIANVVAAVGLAALAIGGRRFSSWSWKAAGVTAAATALAVALWLMGGGSPGYVWVGVIACGGALVHLYKARLQFVFPWNHSAPSSWRTPSAARPDDPDDVSTT